MSRKKQFIAGAICPQCSEMDSLVLYADDQSVACVSCNFTKSSEQRDQETKQAEQKKSDTSDTPSVKSHRAASFKNAGQINITNLDE
jgi:uncharacterized metal-binding protein (TIGR02443 family)